MDQVKKEWQDVKMNVEYDPSDVTISKAIKTEVVDDYVDGWSTCQQHEPGFVPSTSQQYVAPHSAYSNKEEWKDIKVKKEYDPSDFTWRQPIKTEIVDVDVQEPFPGWSTWQQQPVPSTSQLYDTLYPAYPNKEEWKDIKVKKEYDPSDFTWRQPIKTEIVDVDVQEPFPEWSTWQQQPVPSTSHLYDTLYPGAQVGTSKKSLSNGKSGRGSFPCDVCGKTFAQKYVRDDHQRGHTNPHTCQLCKKQFATKRNFQQHVTSVHDTKNHTCTTCGKVFKHKTSLSKHFKIHGTVGEVYTCDHCHKIFVSRQGMESHIRIKHNRQHFCRHCSQYFDSLLQFNTHKVVHKEKVYTCEHCTNVYKDKQGVRYHMAYHFPLKRLPCPLCTRTSSNKKTLKEHMIHYHGVGGEIYECEVCKKHFTTRRVIERHMGYHFRRFKCRMCFKLFAHKYALTAHIKTEHAPGPILLTRYHCDDCTGSFRRRSHLYIHWVKFHNPKFTYKCVNCNFGYPTAWGLAGHICQGKGKKW